MPRSPESPSIETDEPAAPERQEPQEAPHAGDESRILELKREADEKAGEAASRLADLRLKFQSMGGADFELTAQKAFERGERALAPVLTSEGKIALLNTFIAQSSDEILGSLERLAQRVEAYVALPEAERAGKEKKRLDLVLRGGLEMKPVLTSSDWKRAYGVATSWEELAERQG